MNTKRGWGGRQTAEETTQACEFNPVEHYACCLIGLAGMCAIGFLCYPILVAATRPLHVLSSTALVFALISVWLLVWLGAELIWEWRAGRVSFFN